LRAADLRVWDRRRTPARIVVGLAVAGLLLSLAATHPNAASSAGDPVIAAAGDIACDPANGNFNGGAGTSSNCRQRYTSDLLPNA